MKRTVINRKLSSALSTIGIFLVLCLTTISSNTFGQETSSDNSATANSAKTSLFEKIREKANAVEFFSLSMFVDLYQEELKLYEWGAKPQDYIYLAATYTRVRAFNELYEAATVATREDINDCIRAFTTLSRKEKAFVLGATALYIYRSEDPKAIEALPENQRVEPLSQEEKHAFSVNLQACAKDDKIAFKAIRGTLREWDGDFRDNVFLLKERLGTNNPIKLFTTYNEDESNEKWRNYCTTKPILAIYIVLGGIKHDANELNISFLNTDKSEFDKSAIREIDMAKRFFFLQYGCTSMFPEPWGHNVLNDKNGPSRSLFDENDSGDLLEPMDSDTPDEESPIGPNPDNLPYRVQIGPQSLAKIANRVLNMFPELKTDD